VLTQGVTVRGIIRASEDLVVDGLVQADIVCAEFAVTLGPNSRVAGKLEANSIELHGVFDGELLAHSSVHIGPGSTAKGSVTAASVQIDPGSRVRAHLLVGENPDGSR